MEKYVLSYLKEISDDVNKKNIETLRKIVDMPISEIKNDDITYDDMLTYLYSILQHPDHTIAKSQEIAEFNKFINYGIHYIINNTFSIDTTIQNTRDKTAVDKTIKSFGVKFSFLNTFVDKPKQIDKNGMDIPKNPDDYRINDDSYMSDIIFDLKITLTASKIDQPDEVKDDIIKRIKVSAIPIMVGSSQCNTYGMSREMKMGINEDPDDPGGYFIIGGKEYAILSVESTTFNKPKYNKSTLKTERIHAAILSQIQGNTYGTSMQLVCKYNMDGGFTFDIQTLGFTKTKIPFYMLFRMFGKCSDREIINIILHNPESTCLINEKLKEIITKAFNVKYPEYDSIKYENSQGANLQWLFENTTTAENPKAYLSDENAIAHVITSTLHNLDKSILPHLGETKASRYGKLCLIGIIIKNSILVDLGLRPEDDRDTLFNKRALSASISLAKTFRKLFNTKVVQVIRNNISDELMQKSFNMINISDIGISIRTAVSGEDLKVSFEKHINASEKDSGKTKEGSRLNAQALERKNALNVYSTLRSTVAVLATVAKTTSRADKIRYWPPTAAGIYCSATSAESGDKVGIVKQAAITMILSRTVDGSSIVMCNLIYNYEDFVNLYDKLDLKDVENMSNVIVDGNWLGCCKHPHKLVAHFRKLRRIGKINRHHSITWDCIDNEVRIYTDFGRMMRPLLIVDNNIEDVINNGTKFVQNIRLTLDIIYQLQINKITFEDLIVAGFVEYIFPGEEVLVCPSIDVLQKTRHDITNQWTHCDIEQTLYGLPALVGPFIEHNAATRNTLITVHSKQSCGQPLRNMLTATLRQLRFHQYRVDNPLVKTMTQHFMPPNNQTLMVLYAVLLGYNMEDSCIMNRAAVESGCLDGTFYKMSFYDIKNNYILGIPNKNNTSMYKVNVSYNKLDAYGCIVIGKYVEKGDVLLGVMKEVDNPQDNKIYVDNSFVYTEDEPSRIVAITKKIYGNKKFIRITFEYQRAIVVGDKVSSRAGNKGIVSILMDPEDMPYTLNGERPSLIVNPHSIPTRMTPAQLFEAILSKLCAKLGTFVDGTVYRKYDVYSILEELEKNGVASKEVMINGMTGESFDTLMFYVPQTIFRLPKFVLDDRHAVGRNGPLDPITSQAMTGKRMHGGHKVEEMMMFVYIAQGAMSILHEEFYVDSDYRKVFVCRGCDEFAIYNPETSKYKCNVCNDAVDICAIDSCKTTMMVLQSLMSANIKVKTVPEARKYEHYM